jgi:SAM-dependent methyltransferase
VNDVFSGLFADTYDAIYAEKDYEGESDLIEQLLRTYGAGRVESILDLGCGTGNHVLPLAARGYDVVGVDRSEEMLARARAKVASHPAGARADFCLGDIRRVRLDRHFDAVVVLFAVLGYETSNAGVLDALRTARTHLRAGGLLVFDVWYGPAVLSQRPSQRLKVVETTRGRILRVSTGELDVRRHLCHVAYRLWQLEGDRLVGDAEEHHTMRFFFPLELELLLETAGFTPLRLGPFPDFERDPDETTWNVLSVARAG